MTASPYLTATDIAEIFRMEHRTVVEKTARWHLSAGVGFKSGRIWLYRERDIQKIETLLSEETTRSVTSAVARRTQPTPEPTPRPRASKVAPAPKPFSAANVTPLVAKPRKARTA